MSKRIYKTKLEVTVCVLAEEASDAFAVAMKTALKDEVTAASATSTLIEVPSRLPKGWDMKRPLGAEVDDPRTCRDHLLNKG